jgi:hypothetical protein
VKVKGDSGQPGTRLLKQKRLRIGEIQILWRGVGKQKEISRIFQLKSEPKIIAHGA